MLTDQYKIEKIRSNIFAASGHGNIADVKLSI